jgi:DNA polymerase elongation subunit (family B)
LPKSIASSKGCVQSVKGWVLDLYPKENAMVIWIKTEKGNAVRLVDRWQYSIYVSGNYSDLIDLAKQIATEGVALEEKYVRPEDPEKSTVLRIPISNSKEAEELAEKILVYGGYKRFRLYNVDVRPSQMYLYEKDIFPFAFVHATQRSNGLEWRLLDSQESVEYKIPPLKELALEVKVASTRIPKFTDEIREININLSSESIQIDSGDELDKLTTLVELIQQLDPDIIYTPNGDKFLFPYLARRAVQNEFSEKLVIGRDRSPLRVSNEKGKSYVSYSQVH